MSATYAALGMLRDGPAHSYELSTRTEQLFGPRNRINSGQMSRILLKLQEAKKIETIGRPSARDHTRIVYAITELGLADYEKFFESGANVARLFRRSLLVKLALAGSDGLGDILAQIDTYEKDCTTRANDLMKELDQVPPDDELRPRVDLAIIRLGLEAYVTQLRAELAWTRHAREIVSRLRHNDAMWPAVPNRSSLLDDASQARRDEARHALFSRLAERNRDD